jgi:hypothetical protein
MTVSLSLKPLSQYVFLDLFVDVPARCGKRSVADDQNDIRLICSNHLRARRGDEDYQKIDAEIPDVS